MKNIKKYLIVFPLIGMLLSGSVYADESLVMKYDNIKNSVSISGDVGNKSGLLTTISFYEYPNGEYNIEDIDLFGVTFSGIDGMFGCELIIPESFATGKYTVLAENEEGRDDTFFIYVKTDDVKYVMGLINSATSEKQIAQIIKEHPYELMLDAENISDSFADKLAEIFFCLCSSEKYTDYRDFQSDFEQCKAMVRLNSGDDVKNVLDEVSAYTGFTSGDLAKYSESVQNIMIDELKTIDYKNGILSEQISPIRVLSFFKSSQTWAMAKLNVLGINEGGDIYIDNFKVLSPDTTYYSKVKNINNVYEKLFGYKSSVKTFDDLKLYFEKSSKEVYDDENKKTSQNSGSGSGGGSKGGGTGIVPNFGSVVPDNNYINNVLFNDIANHWAKESVEKLYKSGMISGYPDGSFGPERFITRAEFAKLMSAIAGYNGSVMYGNKFDDVSDDSWYCSYISYANEKGLMNGVSEHLFSPDTQITRQDVCVTVYRYLTANGVLTGNNTKNYTDNDSIDAYAKDAVANLSSYGVINGYTDGSFAPKNKISRAEVAVIISRALDLINTID